MTLKAQLTVLKDNWLIAAAFVILILLVSIYGNQAGTLAGAGLMAKTVYSGEALIAMDSSRSMALPYEQGFAPEVAERKITKNAALSNEIERGKYKEAETQLKAIVTATDSFLLSENVNEQGSRRQAYLQGYYQLKVETSQYDAVISQIKTIGEVKQFSENAQDVTEQHTNLKIELAGEKERLQRYTEMYKEAANINDKIELSDRIFNQERTIKYLEDALKNINQKVDYSTIYVTLTEKQSGYANIMLVRFSELAGALVNSLNSLLALVFWLGPWLMAAVLAWLGYKKFKK